jgi:hypothetical protein
MKVSNGVLLATLALVCHGVPHLKKGPLPVARSLSACPCSGNLTARDCGCGGSDPRMHPLLSDAVVPTTTTTTGAPILRITDQTLLTLYKGNDASDRDGVANYGDLIQDWRRGWNLWPSKDITYVVDDSVGNCERSTLVVALSVISDNTCMKFNPISQSVYLASGGNTPALHITDKGTGCFASLGYQSPGENVVNIGPGCVNVGTVLHLVLHALGMMHEHQRPDRDSYMSVVSTNIDANRIGGNLGTTKYDVVFGKATPGQSWWTNLTEAKPFDYSSIMLNGPCHYSVSEDFGGGSGACALEPSLRPNLPSKNSSLTYLGAPEDVGNRATMSAGDVYLLRLMYPCPIGSAPPIHRSSYSGSISAKSVKIGANGVSSSPSGSASTNTTGDGSVVPDESTDSSSNVPSVYEEMGVDNTTIPGDNTTVSAAPTGEADFWPAEPVPVDFLSDAGEFILPIAPDPVDASTPETTLCTANDAVAFSWSDRATKAGTAKNVLRAVVTKTGDAVTTAIPTLGPNEDLLFKNFFREATNQRMLFIAIAGLVTLILLSGIAVWFIRKRRQLSRTGLKAAIEQQPQAPSGGAEQAAVPLLSNIVVPTEEANGDTTDSEIYADIVNDDDFATNFEGANTAGAAPAPAVAQGSNVQQAENAV